MSDLSSMICDHVSEDSRTRQLIDKAFAHALQKGTHYER